MTDPRQSTFMARLLRPFSGRAHSRFAKAPPVLGPQAGDDKGRQYDIQAAEVMNRVLRHDSNCIDVGCHEGQLIKAMLRFSPAGTHFGFEPLPDLFGRLLATFGGVPNVHLHNVALSDTAGESTFQHVVSNSGYSGLLRRRYDRPHEDVQEIIVKTERLDAIVPEHVPIRFMKVDVEGAELQVFLGGRRTIQRCRPVIVFEHGLGAADCYGTRPESVYDLLVEQCGLRVFLMADWLATGGGNALSKEAFCQQFATNENYYFMAHG